MSTFERIDLNLPYSSEYLKDLVGRLYTEIDRLSTQVLVWNFITKDPATWPPKDDAVVIKFYDEEGVVPVKNAVLAVGDRWARVPDPPEVPHAVRCPHCGAIVKDPSCCFDPESMSNKTQHACAGCDREITIVRDGSPVYSVEAE